MTAAILRPALGLAALALLGGNFTAQAQSAGTQRQRIDVEGYTIMATVNPQAQTLTATAQVRFTPVDAVSSVAFELNNALNVNRVVDAAGQPVPATRSQQDFTVRLNFPQPLAKGQATTVTFSYDGKLTGAEESPVYGIRFAAIQPTHSYLMYPARWFPVNEYTVDRYTMDLSVTVPQGSRAVSSGTELTTPSGTGITHQFRFTKPSFPGSVAVVQGEPQRVSHQGVTTALYLRDRKAMAQPTGEAIGAMMTYFAGLYGAPYQTSLTVIETEANTPNGYAAPGLLFISPRSLTNPVNARLLANMTARQWWGTLVSPTSRGHLWLVNGSARYAELLWLESANGQSALEAEAKDTFIEALTQPEPPIIQAARLDDYSPEFWAVTAAKGAAVLHMLRGIMGDEPWRKLQRGFLEQYAFQSVATDAYRKAAETVHGQSLQGFFVQWIESTGAPEFKMEYTVFRTTKGFRVMGKIAQDLDTFRMPVDLLIETEGNPETKRVEVVGTSSEFVVDTFGKPRKITVDPNSRVLRFSNPIRVAVAIRRGEQLAEVGEFTEALKEYQKALDVTRNSSLAHYRVAEVFFLQSNWQAAANEFREALNGDLEPKWVEVWAHINLGKIFDVTDQRDRAASEYQQALRTKDNTQGALEEAGKYLKEPYKRAARTE